MKVVTYRILAPSFIKVNENLENCFHGV